MNDMTMPDAYGDLVEPATLRIQRLLPGPIERVWKYLTESGMRKQWLAAGEMRMQQGWEFELVWRNDELSDPPGTRPEGFAKEHRLNSRILACDPPHSLAFTFGTAGEVHFVLETKGDKVLLTLVHTRLPDRSTTLNVSAGWHAHLDVLATRLEGGTVTSFWDGWARLKADYARRLPG
jgi:uncharacterized protein YndB with AHSA1/START domain